MIVKFNLERVNNAPLLKPNFVSKLNEKNQVIVVSSALHSTTDELVKLAESAKKGKMELEVFDIITQLHKKTGNNVTKGGSRSPEQVKIGVQLLQFEPDTRKLRFVEHKE